MPGVHENLDEVRHLDRCSQTQPIRHWFALDECPVVLGYRKGYASPSGRPDEPIQGCVVHVELPRPGKRESIQFLRRQAALGLSGGLGCVVPRQVRVVGVEVGDVAGAPDHLPGPLRQVRRVAVLEHGSQLDPGVYGPHGPAHIAVACRVICRREERSAMVAVIRLVAALEPRDVVGLGPPVRGAHRGPVLPGVDVSAERGVQVLDDIGEVPRRAPEVGQGDDSFGPHRVTTSQELRQAVCLVGALLERAYGLLPVELVDATAAGPAHRGGASVPEELHHLPDRRVGLGVPQA